MTVPQGADDDDSEWYRTSLDGLLDPFVVLTAIRDESGSIVDFRYTYANPAACAYNHVDREHLLGKTLLEVFHEHQAAGLLDLYARIIETGEPLALDALTYHDTWGGVTETRQFDMRAHRIGDSLAYTWRDVTERERMTHELRDAERIARLGRWHWDAPTDVLHPSGQLIEILGLPGKPERITLEDAVRLVVHPDDVGSLLAARDQALREGGAFVVEHRVHRGGTGDLRYMVTRGEALTDAAGRVIGIRGTAQDVTDQRVAEQQLFEAQGRLLEQRFELEREHTVSETLQQAIMPGGRRNAPGVQLAARYRPADSSAQIGGDWYDSVELDDGSLALVVGDVEGHDVAAASLMGQLRSSVRTCLLAGRGPAQALADADRFLHSLGTDRIVTAVVVRLSADRRSATLSSAGHPPVLVAHPAGPVEQFGADPGPPLGVRLGARRGEQSVPLEPEDVVVLYSDGLVENRRHPLDAGLSALRDRLGSQLAIGGQDAEQLADQLLAHAPGDATDDVALLVAIVTGAAGRRR